MKTTFCVIGIIVSIFGIGFITEFISTYNYGARTEKQIQAEYKDMENILGQYSLKVIETAQVPKMMRNDLKKVIVASMTSRYGAGGSKATFQWIKENYPGKVNPELYKQIQQIIEAGRNKFENAQTKFIDIKRSYETNLNYLIKGAFLRLTGYPKINLNKFTIISSEHAIKAFQTGIDKHIQLR